MTGAEDTSHLSDDELARLLAGDFPAGEHERLLRHADGCGGCAEMLARVLQGGPSSVDEGENTLLARASESDSDFLPSPGSRIEHYVVDRPIGRGGMGVVLRAHDTTLDRDVAIKLLLRRSEEEAEARLTREAQAMAKLQHSNVVTIHGVGRFRDRVYLAMELVVGGTLQEWCEHGDRPWEDVVSKFLLAGEGLSAAHQAGLIHRDFKPSNVMVGEDGRVLVTDFGVASLRTDSEAHSSLDNSLGPRLTQTGTIMGTPRFMAPEQLAGGEIDARADQFAFAVSLYFCLYRGFPYAGTTIPSLRLNLEAGVPAPPPEGTSVPLRIWRVLERGLRRDVVERYPTLSALLTDLNSALGWRRTRRRWAVVGGFAAVGVGAGVFASELGAWDRCEGLEKGLETAWGKARRENVTSALAGVDDPGARHTAVVVAHALDEYALTWVSTANAVCRATHVEGVQSEALLDRRMGCLTRSRLALESLSGLLASRNEVDVLRESVLASKSLPPSQECASVTPDAPVAPSVEEAEAIARERALVYLGLYDDAEALGSELKVSLRDPTLRIENRILLARAARGRGDATEELTQAQQAARMAASQKSDTLLAEAQLLIASHAIDERKFAVGVALAESAGLAVLRADDEPRMRISVSLLKAGGRSSLLDLDAALRAQDDALALARDLDSEIWIASVLLHRAPTLSQLGRTEDAIADAKEGLAIRERSFGEYHPKTLAALRLLATVYVQRGQFEQARPLADAAVARVRALDLGRTGNAADYLAFSAVVDLELGRFESALESAGASLEITKTLSGPDSTTAHDTRTLLAIASSHLERHEQAKRLIDQVVQHYEEEAVAQTVDLAYPCVSAGEVHRASGNSARALELFSRALRLVPEGHPMLSYALAGKGKTQADLGQQEGMQTLRLAVAMSWPDEADHAEAKFELAVALEGANDPSAVELALEAEQQLREPRSWVTHARVREWLAERGQSVPAVRPPT